MKPTEALGLISIACGSPVVAAEAGDMTLEQVALEYAERYKALESPANTNCDVDTSEFPKMTLVWDRLNGPAYRRGEEEVVVGKTGVDQRWTFSVLPKGNFEVEREERAKFVDVVLAVDTSASMFDNALLTETIVRQTQAKHEDAHVVVETIHYDENGVWESMFKRVKGGAARQLFEVNSYLSTRRRYYREEDHIGALNWAITSLHEKDGYGHSQYVFLVTDEGDKRGTEKEREELIRNARANGISVYLIYDDRPVQLRGSFFYSEEQRENFNSLSHISTETGGRAIKMAGRQIPQIFRTSAPLTTLNLVALEDETPYLPGERSLRVVNGKGAVCSTTITEETIQNAILDGRLDDWSIEPDPAVEEEKIEELNPCSPKSGWATAMLAVAGLFYSLKRRFQKK